MVDPTHDSSHDPTPTAGADTLIGVLDEMARSGFDTQQVAREGGIIECTACGASSDPPDFRVRRVRRLEGASDAADLLLVVAAPCPSCRRDGVLTLTYGPGASAAAASVLEHLDLSDADSSPARAGDETDGSEQPAESAGAEPATRRPMQALIGVDETHRRADRHQHGH